MADIAKLDAHTQRRALHDVMRTQAASIDLAEIGTAPPARKQTSSSLTNRACTYSLIQQAIRATPSNCRPHEDTDSLLGKQEAKLLLG